MKKRIKINQKKARRLFTRTADATKRINDAPSPMRGGFRI